MPQRNANSKTEDLDQLSRADLRILWERELAEKAPPSLGRDILALGIAYARQQRRFGGLARSVAEEFDRLSANVLRNGATDTSRLAMTPLPRTGTIPMREWHGTLHHVTVTEVRGVVRDAVDRVIVQNSELRIVRAGAEAITGRRGEADPFKKLIYPLRYAGVFHAGLLRQRATVLIPDATRISKNSNITLNSCSFCGFSAD
jgi:hypothetical protein